MADVEVKLSLVPEIDVQKFNAIIAALKASLGPLGKDVKPIDGDKLNAELKKVQNGSKRAADEIDKLNERIKKLEGRKPDMGKLFNFNQVTQGVTAISSAFQGVISVGNEYESTLAAVGAVTGQTGAGLDKLGAAARELALQFGTSAASNLKSFQGILSKLGPQVAENAAALKSMGETVNVLSAASGDSADVSMAALTDTMLQLGLVSGDAAKDADTMRQVADALAASAKVGAAEIPQVAASILQTGVAAKGAKLGLSETTAAIQVLAVGGKTGSEAGIALRNVLGFLQKQSGPGAEALKKMGLSVEQLGSVLTTQGLSPALKLLSGGINSLGTTAEKNATLMTLFGTENAAAAGILLDNAKLMNEFNAGIGDAVQKGASGADGALAQANARLGTADAIAARFKAKIDEVFISVTQTIGSGLAGTLTAVAQVAPTIATIGNLKNILPTEGIKDFSKAVLEKMVPGLITQTAATQGAGAAMKAFGTAMVANPIFIWIAAIAGAVAVTKLLADLMHESAQEKLADQQATTAILEEQKKITQQRFEDAKAAVTADDQYRSLIETQKEAAKNAAEVGVDQETAATRAKFLENANESLREKTLQLAEQFPGVIDGTKSYEENLKALEEQSGKNVSKMIQMAGEVNKLDQQIAQSRAIEFELEVAVKGEEVENALTDALDVSFGDQIDKIRQGDFTGALKSIITDGLGGFGTEISEFLFGASFARSAGEDLVGAFKNDIFNAKNGDDIAKAQAKMISKVALDGDKLGIDKKDQQKVIASIRAMGDARLKALEEQKKNEENLSTQTTDAIVSAFNAATDAGKDTTSTANELATAFGLSAEKVKEIALSAALKEAAADGKITQEEIDGVAKKMNLSKEEAKKLLDAQIKNTAEAKNTAASVADIAKAYDEGVKAAKAAFDQGKSEEIALDAEIEKVKKRIGRVDEQIGDSALLKRLQGELKQLKINNKQLDKDLDRETARSNRINEQYDEKKTKETSLFDQMKKRFDEQEVSLEKTKDEADILQRNLDLDTGRNKNTESEIELQARAVKLIEDKLAAAKAIGLIDETGEVSISLKKTDKAADAEKFVNELNKQLREAQLKQRELEIKAKFEGVELEKALRELHLDELRQKFEQALIPKATLIDELNVELARVREAMLTADAKTKVELLKNETKLIAEIKSVNNKDVEERLKKLKDLTQREEEIRAKAAEKNKLQTEALIQASTSVSELAASAQHDAIQKQLDKMREQEFISEDEFNRRKALAEEEFQKKITLLKSKEEGQRLLLQNKFDADALEAKKKSLELELTLAKEKGDTSAAEKLNTELGDIEKTLNEKKDTMGTALSLLSDGLNESMNSLFDGDTEGMKSQMKETLALISGFLSQLAEAAILEIILGSHPLKLLAGTFGVFAPLALLGFQKLISVGVRSILNPILSGLSSFATGGVFTSPSVAVVGDASRLGGSNTEYLLRNNQMKAVIQEATRQREHGLIDEIRALGAKYDDMLLRLVAHGTDLVAVVERTKGRTRSRARGLRPA